MARISLLIFIAVVLAIGSVSAHPPMKTKNNFCPSALSGLQTFPSIEISKLIEKKIKTAPKTPQFSTLFSLCQAYSDNLAAFKVRAGKKVLRGAHVKFAMMTEALLAAQKAVGVEGDLASRMRMSFSVMANGFIEVEEKISEISADYRFDANAQVSERDRFKIEKCLIKLKGAITVFVKEITMCSAKYSGKPMGVPVISGLGGFFKKGVHFGDNLIGAGFRANAGGAVGGNAGAGVEGKVGGYAGAKGEVTVGGQAGAKVGGEGKAGCGPTTVAKAEVHAKAKVGGQAGGFSGFGGGAQYDAAGKAHLGGGSEFRSLSRTSYKHVN